MALKRLCSQVIQMRRKSRLKKCGNDVFLGKGQYSGNIEIGSHVYINTGAWFVTSHAKIIIHDNVVIAPNVTIYTGGHITDQVGLHICEIGEELKAEQIVKRGNLWDKDVVIESGCWIGTRAIILKGVTVGRGSIIGAGAIVTKDVSPYSIYVGVPKCQTFKRFTEDQIDEHESILNARCVSPNSFTSKR